MPANTNLTCVTLGVRDVAGAVRFYRALGFKPASVQKEVAFLQMQGSVLALFGMQALAEDARLPRSWGKPGGLSLAVNLKDKKAVDAFYAKALKAGAKAQKKPHDAFWGGYSGYFKDPDGHLWELAWNPFWKLDARGRVSVPSK